MHVYKLWRVREKAQCSFRLVRRQTKSKAPAFKVRKPDTFTSARSFLSCQDAKMPTFEELRDECLKKGCLYEDPDFPTNNTSLFLLDDKPVTWKRPEVSSLFCLLFSFSFT